MFSLDEIEESQKIEHHLHVLKSGANYLDSSMKISKAFEEGTKWPQLPSFWQIRGLEDEADAAISWWRGLTSEEQLRFDR